MLIVLGLYGGPWEILSTEKRLFHSILDYYYKNKHFVYATFKMFKVKKQLK